MESISKRAFFPDAFTFTRNEGAAPPFCICSMICGRRVFMRSVYDTPWRGAPPRWAMAVLEIARTPMAA